MTESVFGPSWYAATMVPAPERDRLVYDLDVDVCVIGGGLAGLTTARELARRGWSVAVLEADRVGANASGRDGGLVAPGFAERLDRIIERIGLARTRALWVLSAGGVDSVRTTIRETAMPGVSPVDGWLNVQRFDNRDRMLAQAELIGEKLGAEVELVSTEEVREVLKSPLYFQGLHVPGGFHIHPLNYVLGLAAAAEEAGVRIYEQTRALAIDPAGVRKRVTAEGALVRASHVVLAGGAHLSPLFPMVSGSVLPFVTHMAVTAPLGERLNDAMIYLGAVTDTRRAGDHYRAVDGDRLQWGGRMAARPYSERAIAKLVRGDILTIYPRLGEVEIAHAWSQVMGYAVHRMPLIGEVSPGLWVATAFGSHGIATSAMAGELVARAIADGDDRWRVLASYDLVYAGGAFGRAVAQTLYWFMRGRDALDELLARERAASRLRNEEVAARVADEAKRRVAEQAARLASEEEERRAAAEQAAHAAAEERERRAAAQAERLAAEEEEHRAAAAEAARLTAEEEERRAAAQAEWRAAQERERHAAAQAASLAAEEEDRRAAEAERLAAERIAQHAAEDDAYLTMQEANLRAANEAAQRAMRAAEEEVRRHQEEVTAAQAERLARSNAAPAAADEAQPESAKSTRRRRRSAKSPT